MNTHIAVLLMTSEHNKSINNEKNALKNRNLYNIIDFSNPRRIANVTIPFF